jgi:hypothetical protein
MADPRDAGPAPQIYSSEIQARPVRIVARDSSGEIVQSNLKAVAPEPATGSSGWGILDWMFGRDEPTSSSSGSTSSGSTSSSSSSSSTYSQEQIQENLENQKKILEEQKKFAATPEERARVDQQIANKNDEIQRAGGDTGSSGGGILASLFAAPSTSRPSAMSSILAKRQEERAARAASPGSDYSYFFQPKMSTAAKVGVGVASVVGLIGVGAAIYLFTRPRSS